MSPPQQQCLQAPLFRLPSTGAVCASLALGLAWSAPLAAQDTARPVATEQAVQLGRIIAFRADNLDYDDEGDLVTASGNVLMSSEDQSVRADEVRWYRRSGTILANGNVRLVDNGGNQLYTESVELTERFEAGAIAEVLVALSAGGRLAARGGERSKGGDVVLRDAAYTACRVTDPEGCDKTPSWRITASKVIFDPETNRISFDGATLELFGARILPMPGLAFRTDSGAAAGGA